MTPIPDTYGVEAEPTPDADSPLRTSGVPYQQEVPGNPAAARADIFNEYRCSDLPCGESPFIATSEEDAMWMSANGYPSPRLQAEAGMLSLVELERRAAAGTLADIAVYSERLAAEGHWMRSLGVSTRAAQLGSIYSLYLISDVHAKSPEKLNPLQSRAFIRAAQLAGDSRAIVVLSERFAEFDSPAEQVLEAKEAARILHNFLKHKFSPRP